jgi:hypothetical protein
MLGISNPKLASIAFLLISIMVALYIGSMTTYFTSNHPASMPYLGAGVISEGFQEGAKGKGKHPKKPHQKKNPSNKK